MWLMALLQWSGDWQVYPHYNFGWLVPPLVAYLVWRRWLCRPDPAPWSVPGTLAAGIALLLTGIWFLLWLVREANPDWRLVGWAMVATVLTATTGLLALAGGWPWLRHFTPPLILVLVAIPLPTALEQAVVQGMTRLVTAFTVEALVWSGAYAVQSGNVILLANGALGVDEACSGVRSFQSNLMAALVVGELYRFNLWRRAALLLAGLAAGFFFNLIRAFFLATIAARGQVADVGFWHDPAGYTILLLSFALLLLLARLLGGDLSPPHPNPPLPAPAPPLWAPRAWWAAASLLLVPLGTELWYRAHEDHNTPMTAWEIDWSNVPGAKTRPVPDSVRSILRFSSAVSTAWTGPASGPWYFYEITWEPGRAAAQMARSHTPDICLPAAGAVELGRGQPVIFSTGPLRLTIEPHTFRLGSEIVHVFFSIWEQHPQGHPDSAASAYDIRERLRAVREGRRNRGQKVLHATLTGFDQPAEALAAYQDFLRQHLRVR